MMLGRRGMLRNSEVAPQEISCDMSEGVRCVYGQVLGK